MTQNPHSANRKRVLMVGYYGRRNFGDDVLLFVTHALLKHALPDADISVIVDGENGDYVRSMLGDVTLLKPGRHGHFDLIVHGGGGVFFDFSTHGLLQQIIEKIIQIFGFGTYVALEKLLRKLAGKPSSSAMRRIGLGIGVGTFSPGSPRMRQSLATLADFDALWLRDAQSIAHLKRFDSILTGEIIQGSDLAFLTEYWLQNSILPVQNTSASVRPRLGVILRDWPEENGGTSAAALAETLANLARDYDIAGFIFDAQHDPKTQQILAPYTTHIWQLNQMTIADFAAEISAQNILLASRAHGAICGACLGVASVIVNIEPKLEQVHAMLPNASILVAANAPQQWPEALAKITQINRATIAVDVARNAASSQAALHSAKRWFA